LIANLYEKNLERKTHKYAITAADECGGQREATAVDVCNARWICRVAL